MLFLAESFYNLEKIFLKFQKRNILITISFLSFRIFRLNMECRRNLVTTGKKYSDRFSYKFLSMCILIVQ